MKASYVQNFIKKYVEEICAAENTPLQTRGKDGKIWQFWQQGESSLPPIVERCMDSVKRHLCGYERVLITAKNWGDYVRIPERIEKLYSQGVIKTALFSDILRASLLIEHGGIWIDATVLLTADIPQDILQSDLFVFSANPSTDRDMLNMASYFIRAKSGSSILRNAREIVYRYWDDNDFLINYFLFLHAFTMATSANLENKKEWAQLIYKPYADVQKLQPLLAQPFDEKEWNALKEKSFAHKLSYKNSVICKRGNAFADNTFYDVLIKKGMFL